MVGSGDIDASSSQCQFSLNVGSGDVDAKALILTASSSFNSGSGDATVVLGGPLTSSISVNGGSGKASLDFNGETINGIVTMKANKKNGAINAPFKFDSEEEEERGNQTILKKTAKFGNSDIKIKIGTGSGTASIEK